MPIASYASRAVSTCRYALLAIILVCAASSSLSAQTSISDVATINSAMQEKLTRRGSLTLRDASLIEALFAIRDNWDINIVVGNDVTGEINGAYTDAPLHEILDSILLARGYGYRPVGNSLVIMKLADVGDIKPLFKTAIIPLAEGDPQEILGVITFLLSPNGKAHAVPSSKSLVVLDFPDRIRLIRERIEELSNAARHVREDEEARQQATELAEAQRNAVSQRPHDNSGSTPDSPPFAAPQIVTAFYAPQYIQASDLLEPLQQLASEVGTISVVASENRVVAADYPDYIARITDAVEKLDVPRTQVRISAFIYDCSIEDLQQIGVNWQNALKGNNLADGIAQDQIILNSITAAAPPAAAANGALTFMSMGSNFDVTAVVNALSQSSDSQLLADPNVVVVDREAAMISIVTEIPFQQLTEGLQGGTIGTTAFREAGVKMQVTPHVARDGTVAMVVSPSFSVLTGFTEEENQPIIDRREASTTVRVANNQTLVIGGLRQKTQIHNYSGIPILQDLWGVGNLFKHKSTTIRESELVVFLTPTIVSPYAFGKPREKGAFQYGQCQLDGIRGASDCPCPIDSHSQNIILPNTHDSVYVEEFSTPEGVPTKMPRSESPPGQSSRREPARAPEDIGPLGPNSTRIEAARPQPQPRRRSSAPLPPRIRNAGRPSAPQPSRIARLPQVESLDDAGPGGRSVPRTDTRIARTPPVVVRPSEPSPSPIQSLPGRLAPGASSGAPKRVPASPRERDDSNGSASGKSSKPGFSSGLKSFFRT